MTTTIPPDAGRYSEDEIDRLVRESHWHIDDRQTNAGEHLRAIIRQLRAETAALRADLATAQALSPWHDEPTAVQVVVAEPTRRTGG